MTTARVHQIVAGVGGILLLTVGGLCGCAQEQRRAAPASSGSRDTCPVDERRSAVQPPRDFRLAAWTTPVVEPAVESDDNAAPAPRSATSRAELRRAYKIAQLELAKARIALDIGQVRQATALRVANKELELARRREEACTEFEQPMRLARVEVELRVLQRKRAHLQKELQAVKTQSEREAHAQTEQAELEALLVRLDDEVELQEQQLRLLREVTHPIERIELELRAEQARQAALAVQRDDEARLLDRRIALLEAEREVARIERKLLEVAPDLLDIAEADDE